MLKTHRLIFLCFWGMLMLASCDPHIAFESNMRINNYRWNRDSLARFEVKILDASVPYQISTNIRHNGTYPYSNLEFSLLDHNNTSKKDTSYRVSVILAESDGRWLGRSAGNLFHINHIILDTYSFPDTGVYHFSLQHHMEDYQLEGITDLGLKIIRKKP